MHQQKREVFSMTDTSAPHTDPGLEGNEKIEAAILALQQEASQELLAHALTVLRRRMRENGQLILAVEPSAGKEQLALKTIQTPDGNLWWVALPVLRSRTGAAGSVMSGFLRRYGSAFPLRHPHRRHPWHHPQSLEPYPDVGQNTAPDHSGK